MEQQPPAVIRGSNTETELTAMNANATATEVSLPGAEPNAIEQPVILRLLNSDLCANEAIEVAISQANRINPNIKIDEQSPSSSSESYESSNPLNHNNSSNNLVNANLKNKSANDDTTLTSNETLILSSNLEENVLDIASHLIETLNDYHSPEESVGIKELTPIEAELQTGPLELETSDIVRTVIEVEPAGVIIKKPLEHIIIRSKSLQSVKSSELVDEVDKSLHQHIKHLPDITLQIADNYFDQNLSSHESFIAAASILKNEEQTLLSSEELSPEKYRNISNEEKTDLNNEENSKLSQEVNQQLLEVTNILESQSILQHTVKQNGIIPRLDSNDATTIKLITVPSPTTKLDEKERQLFIDSLPQIGATQDKSDTHILALDCKREYYQSLKKYLIESSADKPPLPLRTYRWEDLRRAKERGGYPWTHLYKRPLGPDEEPEIVLMLRKSQEIRFTSESPKSIKKVRIHEEVTIKEAERYLQELSEEEVDDENLSEQHLRAHASEDSEIHSLQSESLSCVSDSILATGKPKKSNRFNQVRRLFRRRRFGVRPNEDAQSLPDTLSELSQQLTQPHLEHVPQHNLTNKTRIGKTAIYEKVKSSRCFPIMKKLKIMADSQKKRLHIKRIPLGKDDRITFTEETKILKLKNSPKSQRSNIAHFVEKQDSDDVLEIVELDESPSRKRRDDDTSSQENNVKHLEKANNSSVIEPEEIIDIPMEITEDLQTVDPPKRAPRLRRDHVYEEIDQPIELPPIQQAQFNFILDATSVEALKQSLVSQDRSAFDELAPKSNIVPLDRMGSSEEEQLPVTEQRTSDTKSSNHLLAPISSIDSTSSEEDRNKIHLPQVIEEESDQPEDDQHELGMKQLSVVDLGDSLPKASTIKKEASPGPSEKKVTFSHVEDEAEPHREDIELSPEHMEATKEANKLKKISISDHEYEPIGAPAKKEEALEEVAATTTQEASGHIIPQVDDIMKQTEDVQKELESNFFSNVNLTPQKEIEAFAGEETIDKPEKKGFMASAHDHTRKMQAGIKSQASKLKTKLRPSGKKSPSGSPKTKDRKRFKAPEFSKIKMPDIKRPDMSKLKEMKRPEFTKFDMSKFKLSDKITPMKLKRSKSLKENEKEIHTEEATKDSPKGESFPSQKKLFDFHFGTYPRALQRKKKKAIEVESSFDTTTATEATSIIPSTGTQPSFESSGSPQGDRGPGPVRSRWADKFSDVSYNDSEGSRYRRFESEQGSFDRESSMEQRIREDMDETPGEDPTLAILGGVTDNKQFAEFDEENRAIHEISNLRSGEFKRRPIVHQDSDLRSDDSKEAIGWTEKDIEKNSILHRAEIETDEAFLRHPPYDTITQETQSTTSSGKKLVLEEIDEDEFFLRKRGISQDNIELRQYISDAIRERYDAQPDRTEEMRSYDNYDTPPPKPRRLYKMDDDFQRNYVEGDNAALSESGIDISAPKPPLRKLRGRSNYSIESGEVLMNDEQSYQLPYFDNDEDYLRPPSNTHQQQPEVLNNLNSPAGQRDDHISSKSKPQVPKRQKRRREMSLEKDSFINGFGGRSVSNSFLQPPEDVIVYRTEHEYHHIPLATPDKYSDSLSIRKSLSNYDFDERTSRSAASMEQNLDSDKYLMELNENDGYAVVRKDHAQKPTPPARRKKISRLPGERFATMPATGSKRSTSPPERPPPPKAFTTSTNNKSITVHNIAHSRDNQPHNEDDYEEAGLSGRPDSPRYLQSGDVINKMKYRPLPPPPRPPREKRQNVGGNELEQSNDDEQLCETSSQVPTEDESVRYAEEVEASTQTDPLPDDFVCEEFEITDDMKIIKPRIYTPKTLDQVLQEELETEPNLNDEIDSEQLTKGLQRFRDANQRSLSERSRASSQADQSKALSRPQTPSATLVERQMLTPVIQDEKQTLVEASLVVQPIEDLTLEKDELRRKIGLLSVNSLSKDDLLAAPSEASYAPSSNELNEALELLASDPDAQQTDEEVERTLQRYREELNEIGRQLMETTTSQELSPAPSKDEMKEVSDREEIRSDEETYLKTLREYAESDLEPIRSDEETAFESILVSTTTLTEREPTENLKATIDMEAPPPQPPPRRKSIVTELVAEESALQPLERQDLTPVKSLIRKETDSLLDLPCRVGDLEVDHLRVHALQAGKIMVSQLHGTQISSNELECNSGNLIVKNIELPPGLIEDIVDRVRQSERSQLHTAETQTSLEGSNEKLFTSPPREVVPPPKPPRLKDLEATKMCVSDEQTQTDSILSPSTIFPSPEYLQSLAPLAFYNLHRAATTPIMDISPTEINRSQQKRRQRQRTRSVSELEIEDQVEEGKDNLVEEAHVHSPHMAQRGDSQSVSQAGRNFITACSLSLAKIITQLTDYVKGSKVNVMEPPTDIRNKQVPALVVLFIVITFAVLIFLATGRNIHIHHWDYFNPPGHEGRQSS